MRPLLRFPIWVDQDFEVGVEQETRREQNAVQVLGDGKHHRQFVVALLEVERVRREGERELQPTKPCQCLVDGGTGAELREVPPHPSDLDLPVLAVVVFFAVADDELVLLEDAGLPGDGRLGPVVVVTVDLHVAVSTENL